MAKPKFKVGDRVIIKDTRHVAEVVEVEYNNYSSRYIVRFLDGRVPYCWLMDENNLELAKNALQRLKERYGKAQV
jgi:hypothetical protein